jgi:hypothetical protein
LEKKQFGSLGSTQIIFRDYFAQTYQHVSSSLPRFSLIFHRGAYWTTYLNIFFPAKGETVALLFVREDSCVPIIPEFRHQFVYILYVCVPFILPQKYENV